MPANLIILLCIVPLVTGLISVALINRLWAARTLGVFSLVLQLLIAAFALYTVSDGSLLVSQMGGWKAPYGITLVFDCLSGTLITAGACVALAAYLFAFHSLEDRSERRYFHPLFHLMMFGVNLSFLTGDLFNLFVAFEIMLMASYALLAIGSSKMQLSQAYKYVLLNLLASTVFVMSAGMTYGMLGTLNLADMARIVADPAFEMPAGFIALAVLLLFVFALKGAFFPLWFWLPDTYHTCPIAVAGLFGGLLTKVGVYAVARIFSLVFAAGESAEVINTILMVAAAATMLVGGLGALSTNRVRQVFSIALIAGVGFMTLGLAVRTEAALTGLVFYMAQHMLVQAALFLACGLMERHTGTDDLGKFAGLHRKDVWLSVLVFVAAMGLAGLPPFSGFFGKVLLIQEAFVAKPLLGITALLGSLFGLLAMLRVWGFGFWSPPRLPAEAPAVPRPARTGYLAVALLVGASVLMAVFAGPLMGIAGAAGDQLANSTTYRDAVLGTPVAAGVAAANTPLPSQHGSPGEAPLPNALAEVSRR